MNRFLVVLGATFLGIQSIFGVELVTLSDDEFYERLNRSRYRADFPTLADHFLNQTDRITCGPVVGSIVLNALRYNTPAAPLVEVPEKFLNQMPLTDRKKGERFDPRLRMYTPENFLNAKALKIKSLSKIYAEGSDDENEKDPTKKKDPGISLDQFGRMFEEAHNLKVRVVHVGTKETATNNKVASKQLAAAERDGILAEMKKNLTEKGNYIVANFSRSSLGQKGSGHHSPVAAYDQKSDSFLILDVNPFGSPWFWVAAQDLINAMNTADGETTRGLLFLSEK